MGRSIASVQRVDESLHSPFIELWITHRIEGGTTPEAAQRLALDGTLRNALQRNDVVGLHRLRRQPPGGLPRALRLDPQPHRRLALRVDRHALRRPRPPPPRCRPLAAGSGVTVCRPAGCRARREPRARPGPRRQPLLRAAGLRARDGAPRDLVRHAAAQAGGRAAPRAPRHRPGHGTPPRPAAPAAATSPRRWPAEPAQAPGTASRSRQVMREVQVRRPASSVTTMS